MNVDPSRGNISFLGKPTYFMIDTSSQKSNPYKKSNIFNAEDYDLTFFRINNLTEKSQRQWGVMTLPEMIEHCSIQLQLALYEIKGKKHEGSFFLRTSLGKWVGLYGPRWSKGVATPSQMNIKEQTLNIKNFENERQQLLLYLEKIRDNENFQEHPIFGKLNKREWGRLIWKHLNHHLRQFKA